MHKKTYKKAAIFALCLTMLMPLGSMAVSSANEDADSEAKTSDTAAEEKDASTDSKKSDKDDEKAEKPITDEEAAALETCKKVAENNNLVLYCDEKNERICMYVKSSNKYWWSSPINVMTDETIIDKEKNKGMKTPVRKQVASSLGIKVGDQSTRAESPAAVTSNKADIKWTENDKGVTAVYNYSDEGISITVHYELEDDNLYVYADTKDIVEEDTSSLTGQILTKLQLCPNFGAAPATNIDGSPVEGYMVIPDGSGAVIKYNNGKTNYQSYNQQVFGRDYTTVPQTVPRVLEQAYLPVLATVSGSSGLVEIASDGESNVYANAQVSGQNNQAYNSCYFEFETRSMDSFFMSGENANEITVFEKNGIKTDRFGVRYYPLDSDNGEDLNYADCAEVYRNYLINKKGLTQKTKADTNELYIDLFGGVLKQTSILGIPFDLKTKVTGFEDAQKILDILSDGGVDKMSVNYNDWTNKSMDGKISTSPDPSGKLGGSSDFKDLMNNSSNAEIYPSLNNFQMDKSSMGYFTFTNTAIRVSNAYSRQSEYSLSFGVAKKGVAPALLSPNSYSKVFNEMLENYKDEDYKNIGFGMYSSRLVSDFSNKNAMSRSGTMNSVIEGYKNAAESTESVFADEANAYVLPYVSKISNVPVSSSGFDVTDFDIPFYQMVVHGYIPYASTSINKSSNSDETFLLALAAGSQIHYDMIYEDADVLQDTDYNDLFYTHYSGWTDLAANQYKATKDILSSVSDYTIKKYEMSEDGNIITTTYTKDGKDVAVKINKSTGTAEVGGKTIDLANCIEGGLAE